MVFKRGHPYRGFWVSFEGGEGCGKGTQIRQLEDYLKAEGFFVETGREPGHTIAGEEFRKILQHPDIVQLNPRTELLTYVAAGIEFFEQAVKPVLERGGVFLADRWRDSTKAYQGYGLGLDSRVIKVLTDFSCDGAYPDLTFVLDSDAEEGLRRITGNEFKKIDSHEVHTADKIEARSIEYHKRVNEGYRQIARDNPERVKVIPYEEGGIQNMHQQIRNHFNEFIDAFSLRDKLLRA